MWDGFAVGLGEVEDVDGLEADEVELVAVVRVADE